MSAIKDVAKLAGVSVSTVSNVINNRSSVSLELYNRVQNAMKELQYRPSILARNLRKNQMKIIGVIFVIFVILVVLISLFLSKTKFGRRIYLYGANPVAARFSAINSERLIILVFMFNGLLAGLSGLTIISRITTAKVGYGDAYLVQAMLVAIIGGVSPNGGRGKIAGVMIAILITQFLASAFTIWQLSPYNRKLIWGVLLIAVITINHISDRRRKGRTA